MKSLIALILLSTFISCSKKDSNEAIINGTYSGTFIRGTDTAMISITFNSNSTFSGTSNKPFPIICDGVCDRNLDQISFSNPCSSSPGSALAGTYYYYTTGGYLSFWRTINGTVQMYKLNK